MKTQFFSKLKKYLKSLPVFYFINSYFKALLTTKRHAGLIKKYEEEAHKLNIVYSEKTACELMQKMIKERNIPLGHRAKGSLRIFWVGSNWDQDNSGFLEGLKSFGEVLSFKNFSGEYGLLYREEDREIELLNRTVIEKNDQCLLTQVSEALNQGHVDILMGQMWANYISSDVLKKIQQMGIITVNISMDDRLPEHWKIHQEVKLGSVGLCPGLDLVLTTSSECCIRYTLEGCPSIFWPLASDPKRFFPFPENEKKYDVSFIGNKYGIRGKIVKRLLDSGIKIEAFGSGWPNGSVNADQSAEIFGRSRIILGVGNIAYNEDIFTLKLRDFDAAMSGALYITHRNPDLLTLFDEGKEIECYLSIDECVKKIQYYLQHPEHRIAIAVAAATRARREHTWENRLATVFNALDLL